MRRWKSTTTGASIAAAVFSVSLALLLLSLGAAHGKPAGPSVAGLDPAPVPVPGAAPSRPGLSHEGPGVRRAVVPLYDYGTTATAGPRTKILFVNTVSGSIDSSASTALDEVPVSENDLVFTPSGHRALLLTNDLARSSGNAQFLDVPSGTITNKIEFDDGEVPVFGVDPWYVDSQGDAAVAVTYDSSPTPRSNVRLIEMPDPGPAAQRWTTDTVAGDVPVPNVDPVFTSDDTRTLALFQSAGAGPGSAIYSYETSTGTQQWRSTVRVRVPVSGVDPLVTPDNADVLVALYRPALRSGSIRCFNARTGALRWSVETSPGEYPVDDVDMLLNDAGTKLYALTYDSGGALPQGNIWQIDVATGNVDWKRDTPSRAYPIADVDLNLVGTNLLVTLYEAIPGGPRTRFQIWDVTGPTLRYSYNTAANQVPINGIDTVVTSDDATAVLTAYDYAYPGTFMAVFDIASANLVATGAFARYELPVRGVDPRITHDDTRAIFYLEDISGPSVVMYGYNLLTRSVDWRTASATNEQLIADVDIARTAATDTVLAPSYDRADNSGKLRMVTASTGAVAATVDFDANQVPVIAVDVGTVDGTGRNDFDFLDEDFAWDHRCPGGKQPPRNPDVPKDPSTPGRPGDPGDPGGPGGGPGGGGGGAAGGGVGNGGPAPDGEVPNDNQPGNGQPGTRIRKMIRGDKAVFIDTQSKQVTGTVSLGGKPLFPPQNTLNGYEKVVVKTRDGQYKVVLINDQTRSVVTSVTLPGKPTQPPVPTTTGREKFLVKDGNGRYRLVVFNDLNGTKEIDRDLGRTRPRLWMRSVDGRIQKFVIGNKVAYFNDLSGAVTFDVADLGGVAYADVPHMKRTIEKVVIRKANGKYQLVLFNTATGVVTPVWPELPGPPKAIRRTAGSVELIYVQRPPPPEGGGDVVIPFDDRTGQFGEPSSTALGGTILPKEPGGGPGIIPIPGKNRQKVMVRGPNGDSIVYVGGGKPPKTIAVGGRIVSGPYSFSGQQEEKFLVFDPATGKWSLVYFNDGSESRKGSVELPPRGWVPCNNPWKLDVLSRKRVRPGARPGWLWAVNDNTMDFVDASHLTSDGPLPDGAALVHWDGLADDPAIRPLSLSTGDVALVSMTEVAGGSGDEFGFHASLVPDVGLPSESGFVQLGEHVEVVLGNGMAATFEEVVEDGELSVTMTHDGSEWPSHDFARHSPYYDVEAGCETSGTIEVALPWDGDDIGLMHMYHLENGHWVRVTTSRDTALGLVYGEIDSFSPIVLGAPLFPTGYDTKSVALFALVALVLGGALVRSRPRGRVGATGAAGPTG